VRHGLCTSPNEARRWGVMRHKKKMEKEIKTSGQFAPLMEPSGEMWEHFLSGGPNMKNQGDNKPPPSILPLRAWVISSTELLPSLRQSREKSWRKAGLAPITQNRNLIVHEIVTHRPSDNAIVRKTFLPTRRKEISKVVLNDNLNFYYKTSMVSHGNT